jgi:hypothetical protein
MADLLERNPLRALHAALGGGLRPGDVGLVHARAGVGKSALLLHMAIERVLRGEDVLHLSSRESAQSVRESYEIALGGVLRAGRPSDRLEALVALERHRTLHAARGRLDPSRVDALLGMMDDLSGARPTLVVADGYGPSHEEVELLQELAARRSTSIVCAYAPMVAVPAVEAVLELEMVSDRAGVALHLRRGRDGRPAAAEMRLDAALFVAREEAPLPAHGTRLAPTECTLYSGGAAGAEAAFGECAERFGVREVNFTFDGHAQARTRGAYPLTEQALAQGDVSLAYVSRRLRRTYGESAMIRRILQSLWHQVGAAQEIFVVGAIQEDGTVTGGTGWSVELARMWNKRLWVFDQEKDCWFRWNGDDWVDGVPVIDAPAFCGTGTRYLSPGGRAAIEALFARSFEG